MCFASTPKMETPPPAPTPETANTDEDIKARQRARDRLRGAQNATSSILSMGNQSGGSGGDSKQLLGS